MNVNRIGQEDSAESRASVANSRASAAKATHSAPPATVPVANFAANLAVDPAAVAATNAAAIANTTPCPGAHSVQPGTCSGAGVGDALSRRAASPGVPLISADRPDDSIANILESSKALKPVPPLISPAPLGSLTPLASTKPLVSGNPGADLPADLPAANRADPAADPREQHAAHIFHRPPKRALDAVVVHPVLGA